jgi:hypothetical protein
MEMNRTFAYSLLLVALSLVGCSTDIQVTHAPLIARSSDTITFTATAINSTVPDSMEIEILVNAVLVKSCTSSPCTYTGGPYAQDSSVTYAANIDATYTNALGSPYVQSASDGYYGTGITDANYSYLGSDVLSGRIAGSTADKEDVVFHMADDYAANGLTFTDFINDATDKVQDVYGAQDIVKTNLDKFNIWVYKKEADEVGCGTVDPDANTDMPWRDDDAVLHDSSFQDCTNVGLSHFSAEGWSTKAFLHESGHAVFGLGDEYDGPTNYSVVQSPEPNIWDNEADCQSEQTAKGRDPNACYEFTTQDGGWWGIHQGTTVMTTGNVGNAWYTEAAERVRWYFDNL